MAVVAVLFLGGLWYVSEIKADLAISRENGKKLENAIEQQKEAMASLQADIEKQQKINAELNVQAQLAAKDVKVLQDKLKDMNLSKVAVAKPASIERAINRGSVNAVRCVELASGAPLNEREKNAKTPKEFNPECPSFKP